MHLERTLLQLDIGRIPPEHAAELGALGYLQWLSGVPGDAPYRREAIRARALARPFIESSPAVAAFCELITQSLEGPLAPLSLTLPTGRRRGGAPARRRQRMF